LGENAQFRDGQSEAIENIVNKKARVLLVQRTGWGKSIVYFIATKMLRNRGSGPSLLISPLLSLMRNQIDMAEKAGVIKAARYDSSNQEEWDVLEKQLRRDKVDILLVSPERLANGHFKEDVLPSLRRGIGFFIVDEAHCISDWGHDFRPDYRRIVRIVKSLPSNIPILATTATANNRVINDISEQLGKNLIVMRGGLARESIRLQNIILKDQSERLAWLAEFVPKFNGSGIIYCLTIADTIRVASWLKENGIDAHAYNSDLIAEKKQKLEDDLINNRIKVLVATVALGMGFDKPDLSFVIHFQRPGSVIAYYQQVGRAGRAMEKAYGVLLSGEEDNDIVNYFINTAFPSNGHLLKIIQSIEFSKDGLSIYEIQSAVNIPYKKLEQALKMLEIDGIVFKKGTKYARTLMQWRPDEERIQKVIAQRRYELEKMNEYVHHKGCLMDFLCRELDDPEARSCGNCATCRRKGIPTKPSSELVFKAVTFLKGGFIPIEPRKQCWISENGRTKRKNLNADMQNCEGRALCFYGDAGWGRMVADCKYKYGRYSDELVKASAEFIKETWKPASFPTWIAAIPSLRKSELVPDFAKRLANELKIPFHMILRKSKETQEQKLMQNSYYKWKNICDVFEVCGHCPREPVLLIDDIVDSGWTLTVAGILLRESGAGPVYPYVLANASTRGDY